MERERQVENTVRSSIHSLHIVDDHLGDISTAAVSEYPKSRVLYKNVCMIFMIISCMRMRNKLHNRWKYNTEIQIYVFISTREAFRDPYLQARQLCCT